MYTLTAAPRRSYQFSRPRIMEGLAGVLRLFGWHRAPRRLVAHPATPPLRRQNDQDVQREVLEFLRRDGGALTLDELLVRFREERGRPFRPEGLEYILRRHPKVAFDGKRWRLADELRR